jgi:hypothetical protein
MSSAYLREMVVPAVLYNMEGATLGLSSRQQWEGAMHWHGPHTETPSLEKTEAGTFQNHHKAPLLSSQSSKCFQSPQKRFAST